MRVFWILCSLFLIIGLFGCSVVEENSFVQRISSEAGKYDSPQWSTDGTRILFQFTPRGTIDSEFVSINPDGSDWSPIPIPSESIGVSSTPYWWQDSELAYIRKDFSPSWDQRFNSIVIFSLDTGVEKELLVDRGFISSACWNQSREFVAYVEKRSHSMLDEKTTVWVHFMSTNETKALLVPDPQESFADVACNHQGDKIAVTIGGKDDDRVEIVDVNTGERTVVYAPKATSLDRLTWSGDDRWIAVRTFGSTPNTKYQAYIALVMVDGSEVITVDLSPAIFPVDLDWSSKDNRIVVTSLDGIGKSSMYIVDMSFWLDKG